MNITRLLLVFFFIAPKLLLGQQETVVLKSRNAKPIRKFEVNQPRTFGVVNGKLNIALLSPSGYILEINRIPTKELKCNNLIANNMYKVILIDEKTQRTYQSSLKGKGNLKVNCLMEGSFGFDYSGEVFFENQKININARLIGKIIHSKDVKTNKHD